jgi:hypothetical protein
MDVYFSIGGKITLRHAGMQCNTEFGAKSFISHTYTPDRCKSFICHTYENRRGGVPPTIS